MFAYCTEVLHLSEAEAYLRITAARASREHPMLLTMLGDGRLHLTGISRLAPHLTRENAEGLLKRAVHKSKRQIEELIAELVPGPDVPAMMRKLPATRGQAQPRPGRLPTPGTSGAEVLALDDTGEERDFSLGAHRLEQSVELRPERVATLEPSASPAIPDGKSPFPSTSPALAVVQSPAALTVARPLAPPAVVQPLSPARYKVQFTASAELHHKLERLRTLMRTRVPDADLAAIIEEAVTEKLERLEARRFAKWSIS
jgi:hypothetical protein